MERQIIPTTCRDALGARLIGGNIPKSYKIKLEERWARAVIRESGQHPDFILSQFRLHCQEQKPYGDWTALHRAGLNALVGHNDYQDQMGSAHFVVGL